MLTIMRLSVTCINQVNKYIRSKSLKMMKIPAIEKVKPASLLTPFLSNMPTSISKANVTGVFCDYFFFGSLYSLTVWGDCVVLVLRFLVYIFHSFCSSSIVNKYISLKYQLES